MSLFKANSDLPVTTLSRQLGYQTDVVAAYRQLCEDEQKVSGLLETASISTKEHTHSLVMLSAALKISCFGERIEFLALNNNGKQLLPKVAEVFTQANQHPDDSVQLVEQTDSQVVICISHQSLNETLDEQQKLLAPSVFDGLRKLMESLRCHNYDDKTTQVIGTFSFDCYQLFEPLEKLESQQTFPDYDFYLADRLLIVDHQNLSSRLVSKVFHGEKAESIYFDYQQQLVHDEKLLKESKNSLQQVAIKNTGGEYFAAAQVNISEQKYSELIEIAREHIINGDVFQMVLARDFSIPCDDAFTSYRYLRESNPSPYMFYLNTADYQLFGASPESAVKFEAADRKMSIYPIAGTRKRGVNSDGSTNLDLDSRIELELKNDTKEQAEHLMLVDLARNDVARVCQSGSRYIERLLEIDRYSHVMHLVSKVSGTLDEKLDALHAYQACMNMGTLSGAPKVRATQLLRHLEQQYRGVYGGAMGYFNAAGDLDTAIVIRSALVSDKVATVSAGAGIVYDSQAPLEIKETKNKAAAALNAIYQANLLQQTLSQESQQEELA